jgi:hypothetical protein
MRFPTHQQNESAEQISQLNTMCLQADGDALGAHVFLDLADG